MTEKSTTTKQTYTREQVYEQTLKYFDGDELASNVWVDKYCLKDSNNNYYELTPTDMHHRIAKELARIEQRYPNPMSENEIFGLLDKFKYVVPAGSNLFGIGNDMYLSSLSNCFYIHHNNNDSYGGIMKLDEELVHLFKRRAGCGIDISFLRPKDSVVNNAALSTTGAVSFMNRFSNTTKEVALNGRRAALMITMDVNHPEIMDFITIKNDLSKVNGANISIKITDEFMRAVETKSKFNLSYKFKDGSVSNVSINATEIWDKFIHSSWKSAEPGLLYWDQIKRESPSDGYEGYELQGVNPCFAGNELLLTKNGYARFDELAKIGYSTIKNKDGNYSKSKIWKSGNKHVISIKNSKNKLITCTPDHVWMNINGEKIQAKDLKGHRLMPDLNKNIELDKLYTKLGFIQGDGNLTRLDDTLYPTHKGFEINIGKKDGDVLNYFGYNEKSNRVIYTNEFYHICKQEQFSKNTLPTRRFPKKYMNWTLVQKKSFLSGLYSANGSIIKKHRISFKTTSIDLVHDLQSALLELDINSYYTTNKSKLNKFKNGIYEMKESYDVNISKYDDILKFYNTIQFIHGYKNDDLVELIKLKSPKIIRIIDNNEKIDVYDFTEPICHWGIVNGYVAHNCSELTLSDSESCRLTSINLTSFVDNPYIKDATFNTSLFIDVVKKSQRIMDDIVDLEIEKIESILDKVNSDPEDEEVKFREINLWKRILKKAVDGRRTGLGVTGLGDLIAMMNYTYASEESLEFVESVFKLMAKWSYNTSIDMAKERGAFHGWKFDKDLKSTFIQRMVNKNLSSEYLDLYKSYGRRNIANMTIAPNGSLGLLTKTTSGVEPVFKSFYTRRVRTTKNQIPTFIDSNGDNWIEYNVVHNGLKLFYNTLPNNQKDISTISSDELKSIIDKSPYANAEAERIDYNNKVKMQGIINKWIDHSISMTINLPQDISEKEVSELYMNGWKYGLKGMTIYREGSRDGVLISDKNSKTTSSELDSFSPQDAPKRPTELQAVVQHFQNNKEKWVGIIGLLDGHPYEIFTGALESFQIPKYIENGKIIKIHDNGNGSRYDFVYIDKDGFEVIMQGLNREFDREYWNYGKLVSMILRHRAPLKYVIKIIDDLKFDNIEYSILSSWKKGVIRIIKRFIKDGEKTIGGETCQNCGSTDLAYQEGCLVCLSCGSSKCG